MIDAGLIADHNAARADALAEDYAALGRQLARRGVEIETITARAQAFSVAVPTWGVGTGGTRFARFPGPGEPRDIHDKLADCAVIQQLCRITPRVSPHFPWDAVGDYAGLRAEALALGLSFDAVNSNTFQDQPGQALSYKFGSLTHTDAAVRAQAVAHNIDCIRIGQALGASALTVWIADGSNFPGQSDLGAAFDRYLDSMAQIVAAAPDGWRVFIEHKLYEPAFYSTVIADWGSSLMAAQAPYDPAADAREAEAGRAGFDRDSIARIAETVQTDTSEAIFVTGLPRSGTTLVEQILASHSAVVGGEELGRMAVVQRDLPANSLAGLQAYLADRPADDLTQLYLHLGRERFGDGGRYVDKGLNNPRYMGLIASLMPQSPVIWLRRDPLDCAWSAFRTFFASGVDWSWQQTAIAQHFAIEDALFAFWSELLPDRILPVEYADLVRDPRSQIERILQFCNLPVEPAVFEPHRTERVVSTASVMQVREPIGTDALGSAHPYSDYLRPFSDAYAAASAR